MMVDIFLALLTLKFEFQIKGKLTALTPDDLHRYYTQYSLLLPSNIMTWSLCCNLILQTKSYLTVLTVTLLLLLYLTVFLLMYHPNPHPFSILHLMGKLILYLRTHILVPLSLYKMLSKAISRASWCIVRHKSRLRNNTRVGFNYSLARVLSSVM